MKETNKRLLNFSVSGLALLLVISAPVLLAQRQGGGPSPAPQGQGGGRGKPDGQSLFVIGTLTSVDANGGTLTVQSREGSGTQTISVTANTQIVSQVVVAVSDLQVNDQVRVRGVPTAITASSITAGQMPDFLQGSGPRGGGKGHHSDSQDANEPQAFASATGQVASVNPLTIAVGTDVSIVLHLAADASVTKIQPIKIADLKEGDHIIAAGQTGSDGEFVATGIAVNMGMSSDTGGDQEQCSTTQAESSGNSQQGATASSSNSSATGNAGAASSSTGTTTRRTSGTRPPRRN